MTGSLNWVVGAGGLLGSSVCTEAPRTETLWAPQFNVNWSSPSTVVAELSLGMDHFVEATKGGPWRLWWCAGKGTVSSGTGMLDEEFTALLALLASLRQASPQWLAQGQMVFASSAGSIYAGSSDVIVGNETVPAPLTDYGRMKLCAERAIQEVGSQTGMRTLVTRITNLYGPKQDMSKSQGLISTTCASVIRHEAVPIFVSLGTVRNYVHARDAARSMWRCAIDEPTQGNVIRIISSPANLSVGNVLKVVEEVGGERVLTRVASRPDSAALSKSVFFDPRRVGVELEDYTPIHVGVDEVYGSLLRSWQLGLMAVARGAV